MDGLAKEGTRLYGQGLKAVSSDLLEQLAVEAWLKMVESG